MFEGSLLRTKNTTPRRHKMLAALAAVLLVGGCTKSVLHGANGHAIERCYDAPQSATNSITPRPEMARAAVAIHKSRSGVLPADPGRLTKNIRDKVAGAVVKVRAGSLAGTGFVTKNNEGQPVVATASHVIGSAPLDAISVTDSTDHTSYAAGACIMHEQNGVFSTPASTDSKATVDVAILRLRHPVGTASLDLEGNVPSRGSWNVSLYNLPHNRPANEPAEYTGVVVSEQTADKISVLTGIQNKRNCEPDHETITSDCAIDDGASGGPLIDRVSGKVTGISVARSAAPLSTEGLATFYDVHTDFAVGEGTGNWPMIATGIRAQFINLALKSHTYR